MAKSPRRKPTGSSTTAADRGPKPVTDAATNIDRNDIARRAYDLYLARGCEPGHHLEDWLQAEQELRGVSAP
jgi:Protein of unknown function (DUF2934)